VVCAACQIGQCPVSNQTGCRLHHRAGFLVRGIDGQAQRNGSRWRGGQECLIDGVQLVVGVSLVVIEELVVAEYSSRCDSKVHSQAVGVHGCVPVLQERSFRTLVDAAVGRPGHIVMRISQTETHNGLRKQHKVEVAYASRGSKFVRRVQDRDRGSRAPRSRRRRWIQWIREQVVIRKILIATETALEVIPLVLVRPQAQSVVGIASPSKTVEVKIVEQQTLVIDRLHGKRLIEYAWASLQIHERVVHIATAGNVSTPVSHFDGLMNQVPAAAHAIGFGGRGWRWGRTRRGSLGEECFW
jgi:hypothetical protein